MSNSCQQILQIKSFEKELQDRTILHMTKFFEERSKREKGKGNRQQTNWTSIVTLRRAENEGQ